MVLAVYIVAGHVGLALPFAAENVSPVWFLSSIALAALLLVGYRVWPAIAAGVYRAARSFAATEQRDDITSVIVKVTNAGLGVQQAVLPPETVAV
jgi:integral membrane sensor domain MASE1